MNVEDAHPAEAALLKIVEAVRGEFDGDFVLCLRAIAPACIVAEPQLIVLMREGFRWWLRCDDETVEQFRQRAAADALRLPRQPTRIKASSHAMAFYWPPSP